MAAWLAISLGLHGRLSRRTRHGVKPGRPPNGLELSGPAKTPTYSRAELAGSAPASG